MWVAKGEGRKGGGEGRYLDAGRGLESTGKGREGKGREGKGSGGEGREGEGRGGKGRGGKGREEREGEGREGMGLWKNLNSTQTKDLRLDRPEL